MPRNRKKVLAKIHNQGCTKMYKGTKKEEIKNNG